MPAFRWWTLAEATLNFNGGIGMLLIGNACHSFIMASWEIKTILFRNKFVKMLAMVIISLLFTLRSSFAVVF